MMHGTGHLCKKMKMMKKKMMKKRKTPSGGWGGADGQPCDEHVRSDRSRSPLPQRKRRRRRRLLLAPTARKLPFS